MFVLTWLLQLNFLQRYREKMVMPRKTGIKKLNGTGKPDYSWYLANARYQEKKGGHRLMITFLFDGSIWIRYFPSLYLTGRFLPACLSCEWFVNSPAIYSFYSWENQSLWFSKQVCSSWFLWNRGCLPCRPLLGVAEVFDGNLVCFFLVEGPRKTQGIKKYNIYEEFVKC